MEEKKLKPNVKAKKGAVQDNKAEQKMSYDELNNVCIQLYQQNQNLMKQLQKAETTNMFKRIDYLFKVLEFKDAFRPDFVVSCVEELEEAIAVPEENEETDKKNN